MCAAQHVDEWHHALLQADRSFVAARVCPTFCWLHRNACNGMVSCLFGSSLGFSLCAVAVAPLSVYKYVVAVTNITATFGGTERGLNSDFLSRCSFFSRRSFFGGWLDGLLMRIMDVMLAFPGILPAIAVVALLLLRQVNLRQFREDTGRSLDRVAAMDRQYRREVQIVFQNPHASLNPRFTAGRILMEPMRLHAIGADDEARTKRASRDGEAHRRNFITR